MTFPPFLLASTSCPRIARVASSEELGTMSKNNLRRITLVRGLIRGIHSLTLIISCFAPKNTTQHSLKSSQYTFKKCTKIFECLNDGRMIWFCKRGSQTCSIKFLRKITILTKFGNLHISLK